MTVSASNGLDRPFIDSGGKFANPWETWQDKEFSQIAKCIWEGIRKKPHLEGKNDSLSQADLARAFPLNKPDFGALKSPPGDAVQALWVGHASFLVQLGGVTFLTDPVFSDRCSPFSFMGPKRFVKPPFTLDNAELPNIDFVVISHNHYDHLDTASVKKLHQRFGDSLTWYVPLKLGKWFASCGISKASIVELDWWQEVKHSTSEVTIAFTPAQHWSNRLSDRRDTLWGGFAIFDERHRFYFTGDSGYCPVFKTIGERFGPFDLAAIPIGAYAPDYFMKVDHCNPEEAVQIHKDVRSLRSIGMHCCTFYLSQEPLDEPPRRLRDAVKKAGLAKEEFVVMQHGGMIATGSGKDSLSPSLL